MSPDRRHATALIERIARVRETKVQHELTRAVARKTEQQELVATTSASLLDTERGLACLFAEARLDLSRTALYQNLASGQQDTLAGQQKELATREEARAVCAAELAKTAHYRDGASRRAQDAVRAHQLVATHRDAERMVESWVLRGLRSADHE